MRTAIELLPVNTRSATLTHFPAGACGDSSLLLGAYLHDLGFGGFRYVSAARGDRDDNTWTSHAWLERGRLIVDITADQFPDAPSGVIVSHRSRWHKEFAVWDYLKADFRDWSGAGMEDLARLYPSVVSLAREI